MGTPTGDMLRAASACAGMAVEASAEAAGLRKRIAELERFAEWAKRHATDQAKATREAGADDIPWCKVVDQAEAALTK